MMTSLVLCMSLSMMASSGLDDICTSSNSNSSCLDSSAMTLADQCLSSFRTNGWAHIPDYLEPKEVEMMLLEARSLLSNGKTFKSSESHTVYQEEIDPSLPSNHSRNVLQQSSKTIIDYSELTENSYLRQIYMRPQLLELVKQCTGVQDVFLSACPYNAAYYNVYEVGDGLGT